MHLDDAIMAHAAWKSRLSKYLQHPDRSLAPDLVASDRNCDLGKWIHGEGKVYEHLPEFRQLRTDHAQFHRIAAEVVRRADEGQDVSEEVALGSRSLFAASSTSVTAAIMGLKAKAA